MKGREIRQGGMKKPTIYDISSLSGASPSTVSAVLNGTWRKRRIKASTAKEIQRIASETQYSANLQARGLRRAQSGLIALLLPLHGNRFFSSIAQNFETRARAAGLCPVVVSTRRDPDEERRTVEQLISYQIDALMIAGATDPDTLHDICQGSQLRHINLDLPGRYAPSVLSDNKVGGYVLAAHLLERARRHAPLDLGDVYFMGGRPFDHATANRIDGFRERLAEDGHAVRDEQIVANGYSPLRAENEIREMHNRLGQLPRAIFINSTIYFEGVLGYFATLERTAFKGVEIACYDYDPYARFLRIPVPMMRQNVEAMVEKAFALLSSDASEPSIHLISPELVLPWEPDNVRY